MRGSYCVQHCAVDRCVYGAYHCNNYTAPFVRTASPPEGDKVNVLDYAWLKQGRYVDFDNVPPASCVDLVNDLCNTVYSGPRWRGNAVDLIGQKQPAWKWIVNTPTNQPRLGDVVVWYASMPTLDIGPFGHTAVCLIANLREFVSLDQDWPLGGNIRMIAHSYLGVAGWQRKMTQ